MMMLKRIGLLLCVAAAGCQKSSAAASLSLDDLIASWSESSRTPTCLAAGTPGALGSGTPNTEYCEWEWVVVGADSGRLSGERSARDGFYLLNWVRHFRDSSGAASLRDSLSAALVARGLQERECRYGGRRWETANLGVEFGRDTIRGGTWVAAVFATPVPAAIPPVFCPPRPVAPNST